MTPLGITEENTLQVEKLKARVTDLFMLLPSAREQQGWNAAVTRCNADTQTGAVNKP